MLKHYGSGIIFPKGGWFNDDAAFVSPDVTASPDFIGECSTSNRKSVIILARTKLNNYQGSLGTAFGPVTPDNLFKDVENNFLPKNQATRDNALKQVRDAEVVVRLMICNPNEAKSKEWEEHVHVSRRSGAPTMVSILVDCRNAYALFGGDQVAKFDAAREDARSLNVYEKETSKHGSRYCVRNIQW
jgi:hypothetical protein